MDDRLMVLRRANLRMLGHLLMDTSFPFEEGLGEEESEKEAQAGVEDDLRVALRHEGEGQEQRIREVVLFPNLKFGNNTFDPSRFARRCKQRQPQNMAYITSDLSVRK